MIFKQNVNFKDLKKKIIIKSDNINYNNKDNILISNGDTKIQIGEIYTIESKDIIYDRSSERIYGDKKTTIIDQEKNIYELGDKFNFDLKNEVIKSKKSIITDQDGNKFVFEDLVINIKENEIIGKEIKVDFKKSYFGNINNDPVLKGRGGFSNERELKLYKAIFSTCNIENKNCRGGN